MLVESNDFIPPTQEELEEKFWIYLRDVEMVREYFTYLIGEDKILWNASKYLVFKGTLPIVIVAHVDTYAIDGTNNDHLDFPPKLEMRKPNTLVAPTTGLGADDRAGCHMLAEVLKAGYQPWVVLTDEEERGCAGARELAKEHAIAPDPHLKFMVQIDRRGEKDCVFYDYNTVSETGREFVKFIEGFGFKEAKGSSTDIKVLAPIWNLAAVNLSAGYDSEHSAGENLRVDWWEANLVKLLNLLKHVQDATYTKKYLYYTYGVPNNNPERFNHSITRSYDYSYDTVDMLRPCWFCWKEIEAEDPKVDVHTVACLRTVDCYCPEAHEKCWDAWTSGELSSYPCHNDPRRNRYLDARKLKIKAKKAKTKEEKKNSRSQK